MIKMKKMCVAATLLQANVHQVTSGTRAPAWNGGRYKVRTCDPYDVNVVLYH